MSREQQIRERAKQIRKMQQQASAAAAGSQERSDLFLAIAFLQREQAAAKREAKRALWNIPAGAI